MNDRERPLSEVKGELFKSLAHPGRVRILEVLRDGERTVTQLVAMVGLESSHVSQQLAVLRRARLVQTRRDGASVVYSIASSLVVDLLAVAKQLLIETLSVSEELLVDLRGASS
jgi:DNA-binding transcriptional ArsR family regulator